PRDVQQASSRRVTAPARRAVGAGWQDEHMSTNDQAAGSGMTGVVAERIPVNGTYNFRDVGGYPVPEGAVRRGKLFRSDGLARLGEAGRQTLRDLDVRVVIDLRDDFEVSVMPD